jgi:Bacterial regulatory helix-turn-helix protein, lysR family
VEYDLHVLMAVVQAGSMNKAAGLLNATQPAVSKSDDLRQPVKNIEFLADPTAGEVRIGCNPFLAASFVPAVS